MATCADRLFEIVGGRLVEVRLGGYGGALDAQRARLDRDAAGQILEERPVADDAGPELVDGRLVDHAEARLPAGNQADVDGVVVAATNEFLGAVERVDQEISVAMRRDPAGRDLFLGNHGHARRSGFERAEDDLFGRPVADRNR